MSRARAGIAAIAIVVLALAAPGCGTTKLEHFAVYEVDKVDVAFEVRLTDQLDPAAKDGKTQTLTHFANPTRKVHGNTAAGIHQPDWHLDWYTLSQSQPEPRRTVRYRNQFGQHSVDIRDPRFLLVPAQKTSHPGSAFPDTLDHYKCYEVIAVNTAPPLPLVILGDQFTTQSGVQVGKPRFFCPPVKKERDGQPPKEIQNKIDHLAIYDLPPQAHSQAIEVRDQFGDRPLSVVQKVFLAVPSEKQDAVAHQN